MKCVVTVYFFYSLLLKKRASQKRKRSKMNFMSMVMTVVCMAVCIYVYFKVSKVEKSMILIRQTSLQLPSIEDVGKIASRTVKKQFEFARRREIEAARQRFIDAKQDEEASRRQNATGVVSETVVSGTTEAAGSAATAETRS